MGTSVISWIIGPQLVGCILLLVGLIQKKYPPKKINPYYGYRTDSATKNQATWDEANRYSALFAIKVGLYIIIGGLLLTLLTHLVPMPAKVAFIIFFLSMLATGMGSGIAIIVSTEKHLRQTFDGEKE